MQAELEIANFRFFTANALLSIRRPKSFCSNFNLHW